MGIWSPDFEWSKSDWVANGPNFKWDLKSVSPTILNPNKNVQIWNGSNYNQPLLMANHLKKKFEFCMVGFQIPTVIMHNIGLQRMTLKFFSVHGGKRRRPFSCDKCDKKFGFRSQLVKHANFVHSDERKFHCIICNVKVKTRTILKVVTTCHFHIFLFLWT